MTSTYGEGWDRRCYAFLKRFETEHYLIMVPKKRECLDAYPVPRTWTYLATLMSRGVADAETINGLIGEEVGTKFRAFLKVNIDINDLIKEPKKFLELSVDGKYMASIMLSSWLSKHANKPNKAFPLIDMMSKVSREYIMVTCTSMNKRKLLLVIKALFKYNNAYRDLFREVALEVKRQIAAN